jgi:nucleoside-diphosphate-sugar epimerase
MGKTADMRRVVVTGSSGRLGRAAVSHLAEHGWDVVRVDRVAGPGTAAEEIISVDLTDYGQVVQVLSAVDDRYDSVDAVVHLAAIPAPGRTVNAALFTNNLTATYNVFTAAIAAGIRNVVWASSETTLGLPFDVPPPYIPVDENYPARPESNYSLGKHVEEQIAEQLCRWHPDLKMIGLRFSNVMYPEDYAQFPSFDADARLRKWNLWSYIDARDGAQAIRRALEHEATGMDRFIVANAETVMTRPSAELAREVFPGVEVRKELGRNETMLSIDKARSVLGYEPEFSWRNEV